MPALVFADYRLAQWIPLTRSAYTLLVDNVECSVPTVRANRARS